MSSKKRRRVRQARKHQVELQKLLDSVSENDFPLKILADVVPGGGKSHLVGLLAKRFPKHKIYWFVPRLTLRHQAAKGLLEDFDVTVYEAENEIEPTKGTRGAAVTHHCLQSDTSLWRDEIEPNRSIVVFDEPHHAKINGDMKPTARAFLEICEHMDAPPDVLLFMSGTLETNDNSFIYGMTYRTDNAKGGYVIDKEQMKADGWKMISYTRKEALVEGAIVEIDFVAHDGAVSWVKDGRKIDLDKISLAEKKHKSAALQTALSTDFAETVFSAGVKHWLANGRPHGWQLIVCCTTQDECRFYHRKLEELGVAAALAITDEKHSAGKVKAFRELKYDALITCQMAYEGLDAPRATHLIALTVIRSKPWIEQMLARVWRAYQEEDGAGNIIVKKPKCWAFVPMDPAMSEVIDRLRSEQESVVRFPTGTEGGGGGGSGVVLPLSGVVTGVHRYSLGGNVIDDPVITELKEAARKAGFSDEEIDEIVNRKTRIQPTQADTAKEVNRKLRNKIKKFCNKLDEDRSVEPGTHQKKLHRILRYKRIDSFSNVQLEEIVKDALPKL